MARSTFRPLVKSVSMANATTSGIHFTDLNGTTLNATYVQVTTLDAVMADDAWFAVEPSGLINVAYTSTDEATLPGSSTASAMVIGGPNNPVVELSLSYKDAVDSIKITNNTGTTEIFIVNYTNIKPSNDLGDINNLVDGGY